MKTKHLREEITDDDFEMDYANLNDEPLNMSDNELKAKTAELYGCSTKELDFSHSTLRELYDLKNNYRSVALDQAISCICR